MVPILPPTPPGRVLARGDNGSLNFIKVLVVVVHAFYPSTGEAKAG